MSQRLLRQQFQLNLPTLQCSLHHLHYRSPQFLHSLLQSVLPSCRNHQLLHRMSFFLLQPPNKLDLPGLLHLLQNLRKLHLLLRLRLSLPFVPAAVHFCLSCGNLLECCAGSLFRLPSGVLQLFRQLALLRLFLGILLQPDIGLLLFLQFCLSELHWAWAERLHRLRLDSLFAEG